MGLTVEQVQEVVDKFDLSRLPLKMRIDVFAFFSPPIDVYVTMRVVDVYDRQISRDRTIEVGSNFPVTPVTTKDELIRGIRETIHRLILHEVDEQLLYEGKQCWNPHGQMQDIVQEDAK